MLKKFLGVTLAAMFLLPSSVFAAPVEIQLPMPNFMATLTVMDALHQRKSDRKFSDQTLTKAQLSKILWAANGINREEIHKRVSPAAKGVYSVEVYAVMHSGIYLYDPTNHKLILIADGDFRELTTTGQEFAIKAPLNLVYVETPKTWDALKKVPSREEQLAFSNILVGSMVQSVALAAQTEGIGNCVRGSINRDGFKAAANLSPEKTVLLAQSLGFLAEEQLTEKEKRHKR